LPPSSCPFIIWYCPSGQQFELSRLARAAGPGEAVPSGTGIAVPIVLGAWWRLRVGR